MERNCGHCMEEQQLTVALDEAGVCPNCGTDFGPDDRIDEDANAFEDEEP